MEKIINFKYYKKIGLLICICCIFSILLGGIVYYSVNSSSVEKPIKMRTHIYEQTQRVKAMQNNIHYRKYLRDEYLK